MFTRLQCIRSFATSSKIVFSGIQPSGVPHLGNYFGALKNWADEQKEGAYLKSYFGIMSYHALTSTSDPRILRENINNTFMALLACGLESNDKTTLFIQSDNAYHCELSWFLENHVNINRLLRMHQFKDKAAKLANKEDVFANTLGLLSYPVLMTADIMLYNATHVPVGEDQLQHVEIARDIIDHFNREYSVNFNLPVPEIVEGCRIMSLSDGTKKMSKSSQSQYSNISIIDSPDHINECIKRAKTDSIVGITLDKEKRPEIHNLITLLSAATNTSIENCYEQCKTMNMSQFKPLLAEALIECLSPIRDRFEVLKEEPQYVGKLMMEGAEKTNEESKIRMNMIKTVMGLLGWCVFNNNLQKKTTYNSHYSDFSAESSSDNLGIISTKSGDQSKPSVRPFPFVTEDSNIVHFRSRISVSPRASEIFAPFNAPGKSCLFANTKSDVPFNSSS